MEHLSDATETAASITFEQPVSIDEVITISNIKTSNSSQITQMLIITKDLHYLILERKNRQ